MPGLTEMLELFAIGVGVGALGALLGIGGGLIMVPLFTFFMMPPRGVSFETVQQVIGTSLFGVLLNSISGTVAYLRQRRVMFRAAIPFALATMPGAFLGSYISEFFSGPGFSLTFGLTLAGLGWLTFHNRGGKRATAGAEGFDPRTATFNMPLGVGLSFLVGFLSSILGIGGGIIHVPMMVFLLALPTQVAVATSTCVLMISSAVGVVGHALLDHIVWRVGLGVGLGAIVGAQLGALIARRSRPASIVILLSLILLLLGAQFVYRGLSAM